MRARSSTTPTTTRASWRRAAGGSTRTSSASSSTATSRSAGTAGSSARSGRTATTSTRRRTGTCASASARRRSSRCAPSTTTSPSSTSSSRPTSAASTSSSASRGRTATSATRSSRASSSAVKEKLLFQLTNGGNPFIYVEDANFDNRGELLLRHDHQGLDLRADYAKEVMRSLAPRVEAAGERHHRRRGQAGDAPLRRQGAHHAAPARVRRAVRGVVEGMAEFARDPADWLRRFSPDEWIRAGLGELQRAEKALRRGQHARGARGGEARRRDGAQRGAHRGARRGLGTELRRPPEALARDARVPEAVRGACRTVLEAQAPEGRGGGAADAARAARACSRPRAT